MPARLRRTVQRAAVIAGIGGLAVLVAACGSSDDSAEPATQRPFVGGFH